MQAAIEEGVPPCGEGRVALVHQKAAQKDRSEKFVEKGEEAPS